MGKHPGNYEIRYKMMSLSVCLSVGVTIGEENSPEQTIKLTNNFICSEYKHILRLSVELVGFGILFYFFFLTIGANGWK